MIMHDARKSAKGVVAGIMPKAAPEAVEEKGSALESISKELMDAIHAKDHKGMAEAMKAFILQHGNEEQE